jgi:hypothetical protein
MSLIKRSERSLKMGTRDFCVESREGARSRTPPNDIQDWTIYRTERM